METPTQAFNTFLDKELNKPQRNAVETITGPLLVIAGAGSGKTRVITARITNLLLNHNVLPSSLIALTFTNKAASEMKERITQFLPKELGLPFVGTFHGYCLRILKKEYVRTSKPHFSIIDTEDQKKIVSGIIKRNSLEKRVNAKNIIYQISRIKNTLSDATKPDFSSTFDPLIEQIYTAYEHEKTASNCLDFDDLLITTLRLFKTDATFKQLHQDKVSHVLIDEYQDTNRVQHALLKEMVLDKKTFIADSLCVVGDEDQSIYSWRGATVTNIMNFKKDFPATVTFTIEQNYRSVKPILDTANHVISHNKHRNPKKLWSDRHARNRIARITCSSEYQEADTIAYTLSKTGNNEKKTRAVLYRAHYQSRTIEEALIKQSIPYRIIGGIQFYERKEIKDILAYLRLIVNPFDRPSLFRVINCPTRGLGDKFEQLFYERWNAQPFLSHTDLAKQLIEEGVVIRTKKLSLLNFVRAFDNLDHDSNPSTAAERIIQATSYFDYLVKNNNEEESQERIANVKELLLAIKQFEVEKQMNLAQFLEEVALMQEKSNKKDQDTNPVLLMTLHAAKGLEFDTVAIAGLEEGVLPSSRSLQEQESLEEERRLFYVGITRAKERLLFTHCRYRSTYGSTTDQRPSQFLDEVPHDLVVHHNATHLRSYGIHLLVDEWLGIKPANNSFVHTFSSIPIPESVQKNTVEKKPSFSWRKNQPVKHATFGIGIIQTVEKRGPGTIFVKVKFKSGIKKIGSNFLQSI